MTEASFQATEVGNSQPCLSIRRNKNHSSSKLVVCLNLVSFWIKRKKEKYKKNHIYICSIHQGGPVS